METKNQVKKALIFDPYLNTLGGGERYSLVFGLELLKLGFQVELAWDKPETMAEAEDRFGLNFSGLRLNPSSYLLCKNKTSILKRIQFTSQYDTIFWVSDGGIPLLFSKDKFVHFQVPFNKLGGAKILNKIKSLFVTKFIYNSEFTKKVVEKSVLKSKGVVIHPPIDTDAFSSGKKENIILSVARFSSKMTSKKQDLLIKAFKVFVKKNPGYSLILMGGSLNGTSEVETLKEQAKGYDVQILPNPSFKDLQSAYSKAKFFWHAAGFGVDEEKSPEKVEHFGMTTVEAMSAGCIPIVINKGGQKEVVVSGESGFLVEDEQQMAEKTSDLLQSPEISNHFQKEALARSKLFSVANFSASIKKLFNN